MGGDGCNKLQVLEWSEENGFSWTVKAELPDPRHQAASVVHDGQIWLLGGFVDDADDPITSVLIHDTTGGRGWITGPALPRGIFDGRAISRDGEIFIIGTGFVHGENGAGYELCAFVYRNAGWVQVDVPDAYDRDDIHCREIHNLYLG